MKSKKFLQNFSSEKGYFIKRKAEKRLGKKKIRQKANLLLFLRGWEIFNLCFSTGRKIGGGEEWRWWEAKFFNNNILGLKSIIKFDGKTVQNFQNFLIQYRLCKENKRWTTGSICKNLLKNIFMSCWILISFQMFCNLKTIDLHWLFNSTPDSNTRQLVEEKWSVVIPWRWFSSKKIDTHWSER